LAGAAFIAAGLGAAGAIDRDPIRNLGPRDRNL